MEFRMLGMSCGVCLTLLLGCGNDMERSTQVIGCRIEQKIEHIPTVLKEGGIDGYCADFVGLVTTLTNRQLECRYYKKAIEQVFRSEVGKDCRVRDVEDLWSGFLGGWKSAGATREDVWNVRAWDIQWRNRQLKRLREEYEKCRPRLRKPIKESEFKKVLRLRGVLSSVEVNDASTTTFYEREFWRCAKGLPPLEIDRIREILETALGRPIRTPEQIQTDCRKRSEEFHTSLTNEVPVLYQVIDD